MGAIQQHFMNKTYISNLNSLSALFDRLIVENIKLIHFREKKNFEKESEQLVIIDALKNELVIFFMDTLTIGKYRYLGENRTFGFKSQSEEFIDSITHLGNCHMNITNGDQTKLKEIETKNPDKDKILMLEYQNRINLENRSSIKNKIDKEYENILYTVKQ
jgi:hypothetical protein